MREPRALIGMRGGRMPVAANDVGRPGRRLAGDEFVLVIRGEEPSGPIAASKRRVMRIGRGTVTAVLTVIGAMGATVAYDVLDDGGPGSGDSSGNTTESRTLDELDADFECSEPGDDDLPDRARAICPDTVSNEAREEALKAMEAGGGSGSDVAPPIVPMPETDDIDSVEEIRHRDIERPPRTNTREPTNVEPGKIPDISHPIRLS